LVGANPYYGMVILYGRKVKVGMSVTVSAKVKRELWEKAKELGINVSEVIREALEKKVREEEIRWAIKTMEEISRKISLDEESSKIIRRERDSR